MTYPKRRVRQHIMEERSMRMVRERLPEHWVVREYRPDYGIDLLVELFEFVDAERTQAATLGEMLFVQVKSTEAVDVKTRRVHGRRNVEKGPLREDRSTTTEIDVIPLRLETSELLTVQAMGAAIPVLLFLVELSTGRIYYVCLNDLVEKVVIPRDPSYDRKETRTIHVPARNCIIPGHDLSLRPLETYAKRAKLYAAFEKFAYQQHELGHALTAFRDAPERLQEKETRETLELVRHFLPVVLRYDFWTRMPEWVLINYSYQELLALQGLLRSEDITNDLPALQHYLLNEPAMKREERWVRSMELPEARAEVLGHIGFIWHRLANLARVYEEYGREWFLPTYLSGMHVDI
jgi:hypothetical protein